MEVSPRFLLLNIHHSYMKLCLFQCPPLSSHAVCMINCQDKLINSEPRKLLVALSVQSMLSCSHLRVVILALLAGDTAMHSLWRPLPHLATPSEALAHLPDNPCMTGVITHRL